MIFAITRLRTNEKAVSQPAPPCLNLPHACLNLPLLVSTCPKGCLNLPQLRGVSTCPSLS